MLRLSGYYSHRFNIIIMTDEDCSVRMKWLSNYRDMVLSEYLLAANDGVQRTEAGIIQRNHGVGNTQIDQGLLHLQRFIVKSCPVVAADNDVTHFSQPV